MQRTVRCFTSDPNILGVRSAVVLHLDPELLPKGWLEDAAARDQGEDLGGRPEYLVACFAFDESDRYRLVMDLDRQHLIYDRKPELSLNAAELMAREWIGGGVQEHVFTELPGIFQAAYHDWLTGRRGDVDMTTNIWAVPVSNTPDVFAVREFPPPPVEQPTKLTPNPAEVSFFMVPRATVDEMHRARNW